MSKPESFPLRRDRKGVLWDVLMYIPTVSGLAGVSAMFWYDGNKGLAYLLFFLACFFLYQGAHRILQRLVLLPSSPVALDVSKQQLLLRQRNGECVELVKDLRYFSDYAGKSFAVSGMDMTGSKRQYVFHKGQFADEASYKKVTAALKSFA